MTKKRWIGVLLTAVMVFAMGAPCFADGILLPESEVEITEFPSPYTIQVVNEHDKPVPNLHIYDLETNLARPYYDYKSEKRSGFTDLDGKLTLCLSSDSYQCFAEFMNGEEIITEEFKIKDLPKKDGVYQLVWKHGLPAEYGKKAKSGVRIHVLDQSNGKGKAEILVKAYRKNEETQTWNIMGNFGGYTDEDGYFYYLPEMDGTELKIELIEILDSGTEQKRSYIVTPQSGKQNCYKIAW